MRFQALAVAAPIFCLMVLAAAAADITGTWIAEMPGGSGGSFTFNLKADGANLTGTMSGPRGGENEIVDGKIDGDKVSFAVKVGGTGGNEMKINYSGTVSGEEMKLTFEFEGMGGPGGEPGAEPMELLARRR
ncbi:MAG: hypothetical protein JW793_14390 [Acidobacteria bacterium]|nr:hypothetical protein [Acidobacteriota bacterium]